MSTATLNPAVGVDPMALKRIQDKVPVLSVLKSAQWRDMPLALRERGQFSAGVTSAKVMVGVQDRLLQIARQEKEKLANGKEAFMDRRNFVSQIREIGIREGLTPADEAKRGGLQDITSIPRLAMIHDIQTQQAEGFVRWKSDQDEDVLDEFPAQELVRIEDRKEPRDWVKRWTAAGGELVDGRMIALKTDPIWQRISVFGTPYPPFDFNSGMGLRDIDREEAEALGLIQPGERLQPSDVDFNDELQASIADITRDPDTRSAWTAALEEYFGDQITIDGDRIKWTAAHDDPALVLDLRLGTEAAAAARSVKTVAAAISDLHSIDAQGLLPVGGRISPANAAMGADAEYGPGMNRMINVDAATKHPERQALAFAHEHGHFVDELLAGGKGVYASTTPELKDLMDTIVQSDKIKSLYQTSQTTTNPEDREWLNYVLRRNETFARAYAQWVAEESGNPVLLRSLEAQKKTGYGGGQWDAEDFKPIRAAMTDLFRRKGWL